MILWVEPLMMGNHPAKFGGDRNWVVRDLLLVVEERYFTCSLTSTITIFL